jgi:hypothetical protein
VRYFLLHHEYPQEGFVDGDIAFSPPLPGYYQVGVPLDTNGLAVSVKLDKLVKKLRVDFFLTTGGAFFASDALADLLVRRQSDVRTIPAEVRYHDGKPTEKRFRLVHVDQRLDCFDYRNSQYAGKPLFTQRLERGEDLSKFLVKGVQEVVIDEARTKGEDFFFLQNVFLIDPVVSKELVDAMRAEGLRVRAEASASIYREP